MKLDLSLHKVLLIGIVTESIIRGGTYPSAILGIGILVFEGYQIFLENSKKVNNVDELMKRMSSLETKVAGSGLIKKTF